MQHMPAKAVKNVSCHNKLSDNNENPENPEEILPFLQKAH